MMNLRGESLNLRIFPDEVLRQPCEPVERFDVELRDLIDEMLILMRVRDGIGLAAPQVGITKRFFVCGIENRSISLINPSITALGGKTDMIEGCLSLPEVQVNITRNECLLVTGYDLNGKRKQFEFTGLWARAVHHELDHLLGLKSGWAQASVFGSKFFRFGRRYLDRIHTRAKNRCTGNGSVHKTRRGTSSWLAQWGRTDIAVGVDR